MTTQTIIAKDLKFPEGPAFASDGSLWASELKGGSLIKLSDGVWSRYPVGGAPNGLAIDSFDRVWFCDAVQNSIRRLDPVSGKTMTVVSEIDGVPFHSLNDLAFDKKGNLLFSCPGDSRKLPIGYCCVLTKDGKVKKIADGQYFPNGIAVTNMGTSLVIAETYNHSLNIGEWDDENCEWANQRMLAKVKGPVGPGGPDGIAFDILGNLYSAIYGTSVIAVIAPNGELINEISVGGKNPTNCAFDPSGKLGLVVSEAEHGLLISIPAINQGLQLFK